MNEVVYVSKSRIERERGPLRIAICPARPNQSLLASTEPSPNTTR